MIPEGWKGRVLGGAAAVLVVAAMTTAGLMMREGGTRNAEAALPTITVYKSPTCGCCGKWVEHLQENGFEVETVETDDLAPVKARHGITAGLAACHTALIDGYVVEGHVPADVIVRLLDERPTVRGIAVPGMPMGSPGMEGPRSEPYQVLTFDESGNTGVFARR